jgi:hypothetical protein
MNTQVQMPRNQLTVLKKNPSKSPHENLTEIVTQQQMFDQFSQAALFDVFDFGSVGCGNDDDSKAVNFDTILGAV